MNRSRDLGRSVIGFAAGLAALLAGACGLAWGRAEAAGVLVGSVVTVANFALLVRGAARALGGAAEARRSGRTALWLGASGARFGVVGLLVGLAAVWGGVGLTGLLVSLVIVPVTVVVAGLTAARAA